MMEELIKQTEKKTCLLTMNYAKFPPSFTIDHTLLFNTLKNTQ